MLHVDTPSGDLLKDVRAHLVKRGRDAPDVVLIDPSPRFGRGLAYSTSSASHLLNVRDYGEDASGVFVVTATGPRTELGQIGALIDDMGAKGTPLEAKLRQLSRALLVVHAAGNGATSQ